MIHYALKCTEGHSFDSWFQSAKAFDSLLAAGHVSCAICGSTKVEKSMMAPRVRPSRNVARQSEAASAVGQAESAGSSGGPLGGPSAEQPKAGDPETGAIASRPDLSAPASDVERALAEMRRQVEARADYVGTDFATEARAMHSGEAPERAIYGEARLDEAKKLVEDGVPVMPLPFLPNRKTN